MQKITIFTGKTIRIAASQILRQ